MKTFIVVSLILATSWAVPTARDDTLKQVMPRLDVSPDAPVPKRSSNRIVGGEEASYLNGHQFPHAVLTQIEDQGFCTGQIIGKNWVLTAGHCCNLGTTHMITAGAHNWKEGVQDYQPNFVQIHSKNHIRHENYSAFVIVNDICVVELETDLTFVMGQIQPIAVANAETTIDEKPGSEVYPCGWGKTSDNFFESVHDTIMWATDYTITDEECKKSFNVEYGPGEICISTVDGHGTCNGDSGGPLNSINPFYDPTIIDPSNINANKYITQGVTSYGSSQGCLAGYPDAFTDAAFYNGAKSDGVQGKCWIYSKTGIGMNCQA